MLKIRKIKKNGGYLIKFDKNLIPKSKMIQPLTNIELEYVNNDLIKLDTKFILKVK